MHENTITCRYDTTCTILLDSKPRDFINDTYKIRSITLFMNSYGDDKGKKNIKALYIALRWIIDVVIINDKNHSVYGMLKFSMGDYINILEEAGFTIDYENDTYEYLNEEYQHQQ
jgi:hypothetical protein